MGPVWVEKEGRWSFGNNFSGADVWKVGEKWFGVAWFDDLEEKAGAWDDLQAIKDCCEDLVYELEDDYYREEDYQTRRAKEEDWE